MTLTLFNTFDELALSLPVGSESGTAPRVVLASLLVDVPVAGSVVVVYGFVHVTNDNKEIVNFAPYIVRAATAEEVDQVKVVKPAGENITPNPGRHHARFTLHADDPAPVGTWRYNLVGYASRKRAKKGLSLTVENKVVLSAKVFAP